MAEACPAFAVKDLEVTYARAKQPALRGISLTIPKGSRTLLVGTNGSGKSTLLRSLGGRQMIPRGHARVAPPGCTDEAKMLDCFHDEQATRGIAYLADWWTTDFYFDCSLREVTRYDSRQKSEQTVLDELLALLEVGLEWRINKLSDGQRRRCQLVEVLARPGWNVLIMDEVTTDLDLRARQGLLRWIYEKSVKEGATVIYTTHIFDPMLEEGGSWATQIVTMAKGQLRDTVPLAKDQFGPGKKTLYDTIRALLVQY